MTAGLPASNITVRPPEASRQQSVDGEAEDQASPRVVSVSPMHAGNGDGEPHVRDQEVLLTPRVIDQNAFDDLSATLRTLIDQAEDSTTKLQDLLEKARKSDAGASKASAHLQDRLSLSARMLKAFEAQIRRVENALAAAPNMPEGLDHVTEELTGMLKQHESRLQALIDTEAKRIDEAVQRATDEAAHKYASNGTAFDPELLKQSEASLRQATQQAIREIEDRMRRMSDQPGEQSGLEERLSRELRDMRSRVDAVVEDSDRRLDEAARRAVGRIDQSYADHKTELEAIFETVDRVRKDLREVGEAQVEHIKRATEDARNAQSQATVDPPDAERFIAEVQTKVNAAIEHAQDRLAEMTRAALGQFTQHAEVHKQHMSHEEGMRRIEEQLGNAIARAVAKFNDEIAQKQKVREGLDSDIRDAEQCLNDIADAALMRFDERIAAREKELVEIEQALDASRQRAIVATDEVVAEVEQRIKDRAKDAAGVEVDVEGLARRLESLTGLIEQAEVNAAVAGHKGAQATKEIDASTREAERIIERCEEVRKAVGRDVIGAVERVVASSQHIEQLRDAMQKTVEQAEYRGQTLADRIVEVKGLIDKLPDMEETRRGFESLLDRLERWNILQKKVDTTVDPRESDAVNKIFSDVRKKLASDIGDLTRVMQNVKQQAGDLSSAGAHQQPSAANRSTAADDDKPATEIITNANVSSDPSPITRFPLSGNRQD